MTLKVGSARQLLTADAHPELQQVRFIAERHGQTWQGLSHIPQLAASTVPAKARLVCNDELHSTCCPPPPPPVLLFILHDRHASHTHSSILPTPSQPYTLLNAAYLDMKVS